jgi:hypothetical protein
MGGSLFQIITFIGLTTFWAEKAELLLQSEKVSLGNSEVLFAAVYKSPGHAWSLCFRSTNRL